MFFINKPAPWKGDTVRPTFTLKGFAKGQEVNCQGSRGVLLDTIRWRKWYGTNAIERSPNSYIRGGGWREYVGFPVAVMHSYDGVENRWQFTLAKPSHLSHDMSDVLRNEQSAREYRQKISAEAQVQAQWTEALEELLDVNLEHSISYTQRSCSRGADGKDGGPVCRVIFEVPHDFLTILALKLEGG